MDKTWIVVANASRARIWEQRVPGGKFTEVAGLVHPASRQSGSQLSEDRPGQSHRSLGASSPGGTAYEPRSDARHKEHGRFAHEIAEHLDAALNRQALGALMLVASNPFLGELKAQLSAPVAQRLTQAIPHDLSGLGANELKRRLAELMAVPG